MIEALQYINRSLGIENIERAVCFLKASTNSICDQFDEKMDTLGYCTELYVFWKCVKSNFIDSSSEMEELGQGFSAIAARVILGHFEAQKDRWAIKLKALKEYYQQQTFERCFKAKFIRIIAFVLLTAFELDLQVTGTDDFVKALIMFSS